MIRVPFNQDGLTGVAAQFWRDWSAKAEQATRAVYEDVQQDRPPRFAPEVWSTLKNWLFEHVFAGKCAYCEGRVTPQSFGDAEHWRPKGSVSVQEGGRRQKVARSGESHPGYWWLAYEPSNLMPACQRCNSGEGKQTQFPVAKQHAFTPEEARTPDELDAWEGPLLLHPFRGPDPGEHLAFDEFGQIRPRDGSRLGEASIEVFDLARGALNEDRLARLQEADGGLRDVLVRVAYQDVTFAQAADPWVGTDAPYATAVRQHFERRLEAHIARLRG
jgi:hypothetical protein